MAELWIVVLALGLFAIGGVLRSRGQGILADPGGFDDRRLGHLARPPRRPVPADAVGQPVASVAPEARLQPEGADPDEDDHEGSRPVGGGEVGGEWSLLLIPICVCAVLLFVSAVGGLPGG